MKCPFCGTENAPGRTHCIACGTSLSVTENTLTTAEIPSDGGVVAPLSSSPSPLPPSAPSTVTEPPRVEVEYAPNEVEEMQMPTSQIKSENAPESFIGTESEPSSSSLPSSLTPAPTSLSSALPSEEGRPGPWLALTVLGIGFVVIIGIIYFGYRLIFGGPSPQPSITPVIVPTVTVSVTPTPTATSTVAPIMPPNDVQREKDVTDLQAALEQYFTAKGKYPKATNYNTMLNSLISGQYLTRRIQDPLFPSQQYQYTVDPDQKAYEMIIQFETTISSLLAGGDSAYHFRSPVKN